MYTNKWRHVHGFTCTHLKHWIKQEELGTVRKHTNIHSCTYTKAQMCSYASAMIHNSQSTTYCKNQRFKRHFCGILRWKLEELFRGVLAQMPNSFWWGYRDVLESLKRNWEWTVSSISFARVASEEPQI